MTTRLLATAAAALMASCLSIAPVAQAQTDRDGTVSIVLASGGYRVETGR